MDHSHIMVFGLKFIINQDIVLFKTLSEKEIKLANHIPALGE